MKPLYDFDKVDILDQLFGFVFYNERFIVRMVIEFRLKRHIIVNSNTIKLIELQDIVLYISKVVSVSKWRFQQSIISQSIFSL